LRFELARRALERDSLSAIGVAPGARPNAVTSDAAVQPYPLASEERRDSIERSLLAHRGVTHQ